jgi:hypothetical protein
MTTKNISAAAAALGRKGGQARTDAKAAASRANGAKGGRPRHARYRIGDGVLYAGNPYRVTSVTLGQIGGPHYRLSAAGADYPSEGPTAECLLSPVTP